MDKVIFGTDGIRGKAYEYPLDETGCKQIGKAIAAYFADPGESILIGRDPRQSSPMISSAVAAGITVMGVDVIDVGVLPTAALAFLTNNAQAPAGVMITASHNPYNDNGIKVFGPSGTKLPDNVENELNALIASDLEERSFGQIKDLKNTISKYENYIQSTAPPSLFSNLKVVVDCANGATSFVAKRIFEHFGGEVTVINNKPDGININDHCGATDTEQLQKFVVQNKFDIGIAFDGDGDRVMLIDNKGRKLNGDNILYILSLCRNDKGVVMTSMSNIGLEKALENHNIAVLRTAVGDRYVLEGIEKSGFTIGGEQSGHVILPDFYNTGDGILTAIQTLKAVIESNRTLSDWFDELQIWPQILVNIPLADKAKIDDPKIQEYIKAKSNEINTIGRLNIRPSGTEPLLRIMVEANDADVLAHQIADELSALLLK